MSRGRGTRESASATPTPMSQEPENVRAADARREASTASVRPAGEGRESAEEATMRDAIESDTVDGERSVAAVQRVRSMASRVSNTLAFALLSLLAVGLLGWYYAQTFERRGQVDEKAHARSQARAQGEMALPPLGRVDPPPRDPPMIERVLGPAPQEPVVGDEAEFAPDRMPPYGYAGGASSAERSPEALALERRLSGPVFSRGSASAGGGASAGGVASTAGAGARGEAAGGPVYGARSGYAGAQGPGGHIYMRGAGGEPGGPEGGAGAASLTAARGGELAGMLSPSATPAVRANVLPTQRLLLAKGTHLDCTLESAIDSTLPGLTTCITATDTFSVDGSVVLLERGSKLVGETRGQVRQGGARVFVLWSEARTPTGVVVPLASPGTDELGRAGLPGEVNRHFWERFGAAILISVIDGAVQAAAQSAGGDDGALIVTPSGSSQIMTEVLRSTMAIPPTVTKKHGDRIAVLVARDLDFRSVYELRPLAAEQR